MNKKEKKLKQAAINKLKAVTKECNRAVRRTYTIQVNGQTVQLNAYIKSKAKLLPAIKQKDGTYINHKENMKKAFIKKGAKGISLYIIKIDNKYNKNKSRIKKFKQWFKAITARSK